MGNEKFNEIYEAYASNTEKPTESSSIQCVLFVTFCCLLYFIRIFINYCRDIFRNYLFSFKCAVFPLVLYLAPREDIIFITFSFRDVELWVKAKYVECKWRRFVTKIELKPVVQ